VTSEQLDAQRIGCQHERVLCHSHGASVETVQRAIEGAVAAKSTWEAMPFADRAAIFLKAADLIAGKYRYRIMAATMLGQGKNVWQAEIDAAAELVDFLRFNCKYAAELYAQQPPENSPGVWNRVEYRALDGFVYAVSPFNFTAIGGNLPGAPALMGNTVVWKPAPAAVYSNYLVYKALEEASLPAGVIQFIVGDAVMITDQVLSSPYFSALHFTGSTVVFKMLWKKIADNMHLYRSYPRIVGETGGKNFHMVHKSANVDHVVFNTIRATFENQGQKCSACSRMYVPASLWPAMKAKLVEETQKITVGPVHEFQHFVSAVIDARAFNKIKGYIEEAKLDKESSIVVGGVCDDTTGYYIHPTVIETTNPKSRTMVDEIFGPVLTVYVYADDDFEQTVCILRIC
jgi:1-pyrroline-5-carboxylate dehydrogenase